MANKAVLQAFNRGRISKLALARIDVKRTALSAEIQTNWMPRALGSMMLRPGLGYIGGIKSNAVEKLIPFVFSTTQTALIEVTASALRIWQDDALLTRPAVTAAFTNGTFDTDVTGWTDLDGGSAVSAWATGGYLSLIGDGTSSAKRRQNVVVNETGTRHAVRIVVTRGNLLVRIGSTAGGDDYITETTLFPGTHSLSFVPGGSFYIDVFNYAKAATLVDSIAVEVSGTMELPSPWSADDLPLLRWDQSGDVVFVACSGVQQYRIERRSAYSWSICKYLSDDGPFMVENLTPITITPSAISGDITLTASEALFKSGMEGTLIRLEQSGQAEVVVASGADQWSDPIRVAGVGSTQRTFGISVTGTWVATVTLQYSVASPGAWIDVASYMTNQSTSFNDGLDNQIIYYRIGIKTGNYTSGTANCTLSYTSGSQTGIARITAYTSATVVSAAVLSDFAGVAATATWWQSYWSDYAGWPSAVAFYGGRLWWAGKDRQWASISDSFASFDDTEAGDSGPISRSIGFGSVDTANWLIGAQRLLLGTDARELIIRSSAIDEPITPTNWNLKELSTQGSNQSAAAKIDTSAVFVQRSGVRLYELAYDASSIGTIDYGIEDLTVFCPEIGEAGMNVLAVQRQPETRVHAVLGDGTAAVLVFDKREDIKCWVNVETDGIIEDVAILPGTTEDSVYYVVKRTIDGSAVRYLEKWAQENECQGSPEARMADSFYVYSGAAVTSISGLDHLEGETVVCWGWNTTTPFTDDDGNVIGKDFGTFAVSGGAIVGIASAVTNAIIGIGYQAQYKSSKLAYAAQQTALTMRKRVDRVGVIMVNTHARGLQYGPDFDTLDDLPLTEGDADLNTDMIHAAYDADPFEFNGEWNTDSRLCLVANAPRPCTILAAIIDMDTNG